MASFPARLNLEHKSINLIITMKKIVLLVALCLCVGNLFAQDADKLRDEGDAALKAKDYATVVTKYGEYLKQNNYQDTARIFNCGYAANQAKNYAEAAKYFDMAVKMNYNVDDSYVARPWLTVT